ncbi:MAG: hypothetical protein Q9160_007530 [Pyrenula sp. 1 TL-2023]
MPFINVNSHQLHYSDVQASPSPSKTTLIFVHGLGSSQNYYFPILPHLNQYRCITYDSYAASRSEHNGSGPHSISTIADDVLGLLDTLNIRSDEKVVVVGHSMGGIVTNHLASAFSSRVKAAVLIGPVHPTPNVAKIFETRIENVQKNGMEAMANTIPNAATGTGAQAVHRSFIRELLLGQTVEGYISNCRVIENAKAPEYWKVQCPVLVIAGDEDKSAPLEGCKTILNGLGSRVKRLEVLKGCGHWQCIEKPDEVGKLIADFLNELDSGT